MSYTGATTAIVAGTCCDSTKPNSHSKHKVKHQPVRVSSRKPALGFLSIVVFCMIFLSATPHQFGAKSDSHEISNQHHIPAQQQSDDSSTSQQLKSNGAKKRAIVPQATNILPLESISESELLPFDDFNVQQPAFSDLMRSWPRANPRQQQQQPNQHHQAKQQATPDPSVASSINSSPSYELRLRHLQRTGQPRQPAHLNPAHLSDSGSHSLDPLLGSQHQPMRNHLNEDLDDTFIAADQGFERDQISEPATWVNYLGELGDYIYKQLQYYMDKSSQVADPQANGGGNGSPQADRLPPNQLKLELVEEVLDDYYYDRYENSQVLYYGAQLVREGDIFEIGCYLPVDQRAEWTKSGRPLANISGTGSPRVVRKRDFLGAKQNYSLKIFEAAPSDSGNYRCNRVSRKYHKLVVVPLKTSTAQLYVIQQRLLSVVNPKLMSATGLDMILRAPTWPQKYAKAQTQKAVQRNQQQASARASVSTSQTTTMLPAYLIIEGQPLVVNCNITSDEFVLRRLRENPQFQLAWYKNGKLLRGSGGFSANSGVSSMSSNQSPGRIRATGTAGIAGQSASTRMQFTSAAFQPQASGHSNQRIQFLMANGRQLYISSASYSDAGDYLCSWSKLPARQRGPDLDDNNGGGPSGDDADLAVVASDIQQPTQQTLANNPLAAGSLVQLMAPVKLRPLKSTYHVRQGNQLRLLCQVQRGYPAAHLSWYVGNRLVDRDFLREHSGEYRVLQLRHPDQLIVAGGPPSATQETAKIVEINPIPASRQQMQLTANGRGQWIEYRELSNDKYSIDTPEQQLRYLRMKLNQLIGAGSQMAGAGLVPPVAMQPISAGDHSQAAISILVVNSLDASRDTSRYACRATTRANTDEVTTVIRVQGK